MGSSAQVVLKPRKARPFFGRHPWVFASAVGRTTGDPAPGSAVEVVTAKGEFVAHGLYNPASNIRVRLYSWDRSRPVDGEWIRERLERAIRLRLDDPELSDPAGGCRLVHSEGDGLSGLIVDRYADVVVVQFTSLAVSAFEPVVVSTLRSALAPAGILRRTARGVGELEGLQTTDDVLWGQVADEPIVIVENGIELLVDVRRGQKTGAFLDQRDNRLALCRFTAGRSVLDAYCHTGGFALAAKRLGGAQSAIGIDVSGSALELARANARRNQVDIDFVEEQAVDALRRLKQEGNKYGVVICDPPSFARTARAVERALEGYVRINRLAIELLEPGGILCTASCSGHVSRDDFLFVLATAAAGRELQVLEERSQPRDHPVWVHCLESGYLKCMICRCVD